MPNIGKYLNIKKYKKQGKNIKSKYLLSLSRFKNGTLDFTTTFLATEISPLHIHIYAGTQFNVYRLSKIPSFIK